jgi:hypothetical protein
VSQQVEPRAYLQEAAHICVADLVLWMRGSKLVLASDVKRLVSSFCHYMGDTDVGSLPAPIRTLYNEAVAKPDKIFTPENVTAAFRQVA